MGGKVIVRKAATGEMICSLEDRLPDLSARLALTSDNQRLVYVSQDNVVKIVDLNSAQVRRSFPIKAVSTQVAYPWSFSQDASKVAAIADTNTCEIWDVQTGQKLLSIKGTDFMLGTFSPDGKTIATAFPDGTVKLWDLATGKEFASFKGLHLPRNLVFSPQGNLMASGGMNGEIMLWDIETRKEQFTLKGHSGSADALAFSADGKRLASASDRKIKLWDINTGQEMLGLSGHTGMVTGLAFAPDGSFLASSSLDGTIRLWRAATDADVQARRGQ